MQANIPCIVHLMKDNSYDKQLHNNLVHPFYFPFLIFHAVIKHTVYMQHD